MSLEDSWLEESGEELEELSHPAALSLLRESDNIVSSLASRIAKLYEILNTRDEPRKAILSRIKRIGLTTEPPPRIRGAAIDSTYPANGGIELVGGLLIGVVAGYVLFGNACSGGIPCRRVFARALLAETEDAKKKLQLYAKLLEKKVAHYILRAVRENRLGLDLVLFDGELIPYHLVFRSSRIIESHSLLKKLESSVDSLLEKAREESITLIGVVKRSYSRLLSSIVGAKLPLNDKAVVSILLKPGEYIDLGDYSSLLPLYSENPQLEEEKRVKLAKTINERLKSKKEYREVRILFYKPSIPVAYSQAVKIEVLDYANLGVEKIVSILDQLTNPATSIPYPVDLVDEYVRFEARILELLRRRVAAKMAGYEYGRESITLLGYTNPEKRYLAERPLRREAK